MTSLLPDTVSFSRKQWVTFEHVSLQLLQPLHRSISLQASTRDIFQMALNAYIEHDDNPDLTEERSTCTFSTEEVAALLWGGKEVRLETGKGFQKLKRRREIRSAVYSYFELADSKPRALMTRQKLIEDSQRKVLGTKKKTFSFKSSSSAKSPIIDVNDREEGAAMRMFLIVLAHTQICPRPGRASALPAVHNVLAGHRRTGTRRAEERVARPRHTSRNHWNLCSDGARAQ